MESTKVPMPSKMQSKQASRSGEPAKLHIQSVLSLHIWINDKPMRSTAAAAAVNAYCLCPLHRRTWRNALQWTEKVMSCMKDRSNKLQRTPSDTVGMVTLDVHILDGHSLLLKWDRTIGIDFPEPWLVNERIIRVLYNRGTLLTVYL